ncbi:Transcription factor MYB3R-3 [Lachnellula suecica]|uniref:Transcription factor MYB3R-3 n=1 Tax=Lachnellula suecica TaxID=602035 RepID=A0A8T9CIT5_9HELO|nr:Transcription factor MYB3R-3 [Lachnellula suecica]
MSKRSDRADLGPASGIPPSSHNHPAVADASVKLETTPSSGARNKRQRVSVPGPAASFGTMSSSSSNVPPPAGSQDEPSMSSPSMGPPAKKSRTNTPWTPAEEQRLKTMRDAGNSWADIAKTFPQRTEGSVKKHWYKDMHYAEFAEDESQALLNAIKEYETNKWKVIGAKVGKPAKACEQYAKEHFGKS